MNQRIYSEGVQTAKSANASLNIGIREATRLALMTNFTFSRHVHWFPHSPTEGGSVAINAIRSFVIICTFGYINLNKLSVDTD
jgi:hypothetical protein